MFKLNTCKTGCMRDIVHTRPLNSSENRLMAHSRALYHNMHHRLVFGVTVVVDHGVADILTYDIRVQPLQRDA